MIFIVHSCSPLPGVLKDLVSTKFTQKAVLFARGTSKPHTLWKTSLLVSCPDPALWPPSSVDISDL